MNARLHRWLLAGLATLSLGLFLVLVEADMLAPGPALVVSLLLPVVLHVGTIALECLMAWPSRQEASDPRARDLGLWLRAGLREVWDAARAFYVAQPFFARQPLVSAPPSAKRQPVLLLHGYFCNRALWQPLAKRLAAAGHCVAAIDLEPTWGSIDDYAPQIAQAVAALQRETGAARVALVGHSMGGLAARAYLRAWGDAAVDRVVTLGTPHRGTRHARFGQGLNVQQMRPDSPWLMALAASENRDLRSRFTVILSLQDNIVAPQAIQTLPDARTVHVHGIGHVSLAYDPGVMDQVLDALAQK